MPHRKPLGLRLNARSHTWYRLDAEDPAQWQWTPFPTPRYRFDSFAGRFRVRYAGDAQRVMMRERFDEVARIVSAAELDLYVTELTGTVRVLDLRHERNLDALGLDDQISTSRAPGVWVACQRLSDLVVDWYGERCHGIVYRSRTTPQRSANLALFAHAPLTVRSLGPLSRHNDLLTASVLADGFTIESWN